MHLILELVEQSQQKSIKLTAINPNPINFSFSSTSPKSSSALQLVSQTCSLNSSAPLKFLYCHNRYQEATTKQMYLKAKPPLQPNKHKSGCQYIIKSLANIFIITDSEQLHPMRQQKLLPLDLALNVCKHEHFHRLKYRVWGVGFSFVCLFLNSTE